MNSIIEQMVNAYGANNHSVTEKKNILKEVVQEVILCGLSRAGFFKSAVIYGGTALRIFYGLDRFSEDLDFSLTAPAANFDLNAFLPIVEKEVKSFGLNFTTETKQKSNESNIKSAFIKGNTKEVFLTFYADESEMQKIPANETIKIKLEIDINPPSGATFERKYRLLPLPYEVGLYDMPSLFAGKIHAVICRTWKNRVKGRDLYDFIFYLQHNTPVNINHLYRRLVQSEYIADNKTFTIEDVKRILKERFMQIDYEQAKKDVEPFIKDTKALELWNAEFFCAITENLTGMR